MHLDKAKSLTTTDWHTKARDANPEGRHFIDGHLRPGHHDRVFEAVHDPALGRLQAIRLRTRQVL